MPKFMVLYRSSISASEQMAKAPPEQKKAEMDLWMAWSKKAGKAIVDLGAPLGAAKALKGAPIPGGSIINGFSILQGESGRQIEELMKDHPHFKAPGASIEVLEFLAMAGMPQK